MVGRDLSKISKVLVIGSGPIIIGQAADFDYSGPQDSLYLFERFLQMVRR